MIFYWTNFFYQIDYLLNWLNESFISYLFYTVYIYIYMHMYGFKYLAYDNFIDYYWFRYFVDFAYTRK